jgi:hypothetical protein
MAKPKPNYAERYMRDVAVRNEIIAILKRHGIVEEAHLAADEIIAINPDEAFERMMRPAAAS